MQRLKHPKSTHVVQSLEETFTFSAVATVKASSLLVGEATVAFQEMRSIETIGLQEEKNFVVYWYSTNLRDYLVVICHVGF